MTPAERLRAAADWLDTADRAASTLAAAQSYGLARSLALQVPPPERPWEGTELQDWLRWLADICEETRHVIVLTDAGWTIEHPLSERIDGDRFGDCPFRSYGGPRTFRRGRFFLNDDGSIGAPV